MDYKKIAAKILSLRGASSSVVLPGPLKESLGPEGYAEAMRLRWLESDAETGFLHITQHRNKLDDMHRLVEADETHAVGDTVIVADGDGSYTGTVSSINPDGSYAVSFPDGAKPKNMATQYRSNQLKSVSSAEPSERVGAKPTGQPSDQTKTPPTSPSTAQVGASLTPGVGRT